MKLGMFMMPLHPLDRIPAQTLREDREAIILADELGFHDAFVGEHLTDRAENVTSSLIFLSSLIPVTKQIKLASGTCNLSHMHPVLIANHVAMFDQLAEGRFIFGVSPGALPTDAEALGILKEDRSKLFVEAIDVILAIWDGEAPYDIDFPDNRFKVSTRSTMRLEIGMGHMAKPYQNRRPEIVGTVVAPNSKGVVAMGQRDFHPLSANFLLSSWVKTHWDQYAEGKRLAGQVANVSDWRVARSIFVADDENTARKYGREDTNSPYRFYHKQMRTKLQKRIEVFKESPDQSDESITLDYVMDRLHIGGTVNSVVDQILALRDVTGDFGELVYANMDWVDPALAKRSMVLMAEQVMPRVNAAIKS